MKTIYLASLAVFSFLFLNGCYTKILWDVDDPVAASYSSDQEEIVNFYPGPYAIFYTDPWWPVRPPSIGGPGDPIHPGHPKPIHPGEKTAKTDTPAEQPIDRGPRPGPTGTTINLPPPSSGGGGAVTSERPQQTTSTPVRERNTSDDRKDTRNSGSTTTNKEKK